MNSYYHSLILKNDGTLWCCGQNAYGQLGLGDTNNFTNIPVDKFEKIKVLYTNPTDTFITGLISFDNKTTWKAFDGLSWTTISDTTPNNILLNGMSMDKINNLDKNKLIAGGFTGNMDFLITMKTNDVNKTPSITKIYIEYKNN